MYVKKNFLVFSYIYKFNYNAGCGNKTQLFGKLLLTVQ